MLFRSTRSCLTQLNRNLTVTAARNFQTMPMLAMAQPATHQKNAMIEEMIADIDINKTNKKNLIDIHEPMLPKRTLRSQRTALDKEMVHCCTVKVYGVQWRVANSFSQVMLRAAHGMYV